MNLRPLRGRPLVVLTAVCLALRLLLPAVFQIRQGGPEKSGSFRELLESGRELTVTAAGQISRSDTSGSQVRLTVSGLTIRYQDTVYIERSYGCLIYLDQEVPGAVPGNYISFTGKASLPGEARCPGQYDALSAMEALRIGYLFYDAVITDFHKRITLNGMLAFLRRKMTDSFETICSPEDAGVLCALTLGDSRGMDDSLRDLYAAGGISHMLAISGMHIGFAGMGLYQLLRKRRLGIMTSAAAAGCVTFCFCLMTGMSVSACRALIMFICWLAAAVTGRTYDSFCAAALALLVIALPDPAVLTQSGLWLSFGCVLSLGILGPRLGGIFGKGALSQRLTSSLAVFLGTLPLTCFFFRQFGALSVLVNLAAIPLMPCLMVMGLLAGFTGIFCVPAGIFLAGACHALLAVLEGLCRAAAALPHAVVITGQAPLWHVFASYAVLAAACFLSKDRTRGVRRLMFAGAAAGMILLAFRPAPLFRVDFLDVGQGDCTLISAGGTNVMIDCGSSSESGIWERKVESALKYYGIGKLDALFLTHGDLDHYSAFAEYLDNQDRSFGGVKIDTVVTGENIGFDEELRQLTDKAARQGISVVTISPGMETGIGKGKIRCLYPTAKQCEVLGNPEDKNIRSLTMEVSFGNLCILLPGDLEGKGEELLVKEYAPEWERTKNDGQIRILKCGHHGSAGASQEGLLSIYAPRAALISCGRNNRYGHPAPETLERLEKEGVSACRTDRSGTVTLSIRNGKVRLDAYTNRKRVMLY